jgi:hypothetical protein
MPPCDRDGIRAEARIAQHGAVMVVEFSREIFRPLGEDVATGDLLIWADDNGRRFSDRLWLAKQADRDAIDAILRGAVASGDDPLKAAKRLEDYLTPQAQLARYPADYPDLKKAGRVKPFSEQPKGVATRTPRSGMGNYAARRLARTEMTRAFGQATIQAAELNPFTEGLKWNLSARHPKPDECDSNARRSSRGMEPGVYRPRDVPRYPNHPHDLCYLSPVTVEDTEAVIGRLRRELAAEEREDPIALPANTLWRRATMLFRVAKALVTREAA